MRERSKLRYYKENFENGTGGRAPILLSEFELSVAYLECQDITADEFCKIGILAIEQIISAHDAAPYAYSEEEKINAESDKAWAIKVCEGSL